MWSPYVKARAFRLRLNCAASELVWTRTLGRPLNFVTLPDGWMLTSVSVPAVITTDAKGRVMLRFTNIRALTRLIKTGMPGPEGSVSKLQWSEANQRLTKLALEVLGPEAQLWNGNGGGYWQYQQLRSRGNTIEAGTSEILRNIIAERVLGLPRSR